MIAIRFPHPLMNLIDFVVERMDLASLPAFIRTIVILPYFLRSFVHTQGSRFSCKYSIDFDSWQITFMGAAPSFLLPLIPVAAGLLERFLSSGQRDRSPTVVAIEQHLQRERQARNEAERQRAEAERYANEVAQRFAAEQEQVARAREAAERAEQFAQEAAARAQREKAEADAARAAQHEAESQAEASRRAEVEAVKRAHRECEAARVERAAKEQAEQDAARIAEELEDAKQKWRDGIQPVVWPTEEEYNNTLEARQYKEGYFHFAVAGTAGCGKSSLINAFRGVVNGGRTAAAAGVIETTLEIGRYPDPRRDYPFVWYDIPGAGTLQIPRWEYFNQQGLFIFDCIIVLWDNRLTDTDMAIVDNCARFKIPCFIVRSKSDVHINNLATDMEALIEADDSIDEDEKEQQLETVFSRARTIYCEESRSSVKRNLQKAELPAQEVYLVTNQLLRRIVQGKLRPEEHVKIIDEVNLIHDILATADERRSVPSMRNDAPKSGSSLLAEGFHMLSNTVSSRWRGGSSTR